MSYNTLDPQAGLPEKPLDDAAIDEAFDHAHRTDHSLDALYEKVVQQEARQMSDARLKAEIRRFDARSLLAQGDGRQTLKLPEPAPGAQVPETVQVKHDPASAFDGFAVDLAIDPTKQPASVVQSAVMDANGDVRMEFHMTPDDRRQAARAAQDMARQHASMLGSPAGLRGLFQTNNCRFIIKKRPSPPVIQEAQE